MNALLVNIVPGVAQKTISMVYSTLSYNSKLIQQCCQILEFYCEFRNGLTRHNLTGRMGRRGKKGVTGSAGPKGVPGVKGVTGPPGADGEIVGDIYSLFNIYYKLT